MSETLSENDWGHLIGYISKGELTPIIGKEMYKYRVIDPSKNLEQGNGGKTELQPIEEYFSRELLKQYNLPEQSLSFAETLRLLKIEKKCKVFQIVNDLKAIAENVQFDFPLLTKFFGIQKIMYYFNTTLYDVFLERSFKKARGLDPTAEVKGIEPVINFEIKGTVLDCDNIKQLKKPFLFNIFGSLDDTIDPALMEEDMLEITSRFKEKMDLTKNLQSALSKNLLFLGCPNPDWLVRFFYRQLSYQPLNQWAEASRQIIIVNDPSEYKQKQYGFLNNYEVATYDKSIDEFIEELSFRWNSKYPPTKKIFLSYSEVDKEAVENLKSALEKINNVTCWYDKTELYSGDNYNYKILQSVESADLFIPLISKNSLARQTSYVQREWITSSNTYQSRLHKGNTNNFIMPLIIDDTGVTDPAIPDFFRSMTIQTFANGVPDENFINVVTKTINPVTIL